MDVSDINLSIFELRGFEERIDSSIKGNRFVKLLSTNKIGISYMAYFFNHVRRPCIIISIEIVPTIKAIILPTISIYL